jgi:uracil-DNA glycosylase
MRAFRLKAEGISLEETTSLNEATGLEEATTIDRVRRDIISCTRCDQLRTYCARIAHEKKAAHRADVYWGRPVPGFGDPDARVLVLGLAPAAHGANRTGRVFTGDGSGDFLMTAMHSAGFANITTSQRADDGLTLTDAYIVAAVRCAPPDNKPTPAEIAACAPHLVAETAALVRVRVIVALGRIGFDAAWRLLRDRGIVPERRPAFGHGLVYEPARGPAVIASYHPSRQNTNTGKLTPKMMSSVFQKAARYRLTPLSLFPASGSSRRASVAIAPDGAERAQLPTRPLRHTPAR